MNPALKLTLFGSPQITYQGQPLTGFVSAKVRALLIYLAATARPHSRDHLAHLLWEDTPASMKVNLRKALSNLHQLVGDVLVEEGNRVVALNMAQCWVDVHEFDQRYKHLGVDQATALYQAEFLNDFQIDITEDFEKWVLSEQTRLKLQMIDLLRLLAAQHEKARNLPDAICTVRRLLDLEPWHEETHGWLMELLARSGQRSAALAQFDRCEEIIRKELDVPLSQATFDLYFQIKNDEYKHGKFKEEARPQHELPDTPVYTPLNAYSSTATPFVVGPPISQPHLFWGREMEVARIFGWWRQAPLAHVALIGPRRSGKTSLFLYLQTIAKSQNLPLRANQKRNWLPHSERYRWVWVDFQEARMRNQQRLLQHLLLGFGLEPPAECSLESFMDVACSHRWDEPVIVLMDELGAGLAAPELDQSFWWTLRALTQITDGQLAFAVAAHDSPMRLAEDQGKPSPFFNIFTSLELGPFTNAEAMTFIASSPRPFSAEDVAWIFAQSQSWPFLLQMLCEERLFALEQGVTDNHWQAAGLRRLEPFRYLLLKEEVG